VLTVWCVSWGNKYSDYYPQRLQREVRKNLTIPHRFICVTDRTIDEVATMPPINDLPGWFGKVNLFSPAVATDQNLFLDLDVVITGSLDDLVTQYVGCDLAMPANWAQSGWGGCQSSVMLWNGGEASQKVYKLFDHSRVNWPPISGPGILYGDQEWCTELREADE